VYENAWTIPYPDTSVCRQDPDDVLEALEEYFLSTAPEASPEPLPQRPPEPPVGQEFKALLIKIGVIVGAALLIFNFVYGFHYNRDPSMSPSVKDGDLMIFYRWDKKYHADDLILLSFQGKSQVRRVVATAGDTVDITEEGLLVNGALQQEPGISQKTQRYAEGISLPVTLGEGQVFVLGDARENATDSRVYGPVNVKDTQGTVITNLRRRNL
jgi:signal peptidase I